MEKQKQLNYQHQMHQHSYCVKASPHNSH